MNMKNLVLMAVCMIAILATVSNVSAVPADVQWLKLNGDELSPAVGFNENLNVERGEKLNIKIKLKADEAIENVQAYARISGYRYANQEQDSVYDATNVIDMDENDTEIFNLALTVPTKADKDYYYMSIQLEGRAGTIETYQYSLHVKGLARDKAIEIKDYDLNPSKIVNAGRALSAKVTVKNMGDETLNDVKVIVSIPELGIQDSENIDEITADETETFEELLLRIPTNAEPNTYTVKIEVKFDEYESQVVTDAITVQCPLGNSCDGTNKEPTKKSVLNVPTSMEFTDNGAAFPIVIENNGKADAVYSLNVQGVTWGEVSFDPSADVIVPAKSTRTVYLYITSDNVQAGEKYFKLQVTSGTETSEVPLSVTVPESTSRESLKNALEIGLIILVVILIIIGLIIGFSKLKDNPNKEDEEAETYY